MSSFTFTQPVIDQRPEQPPAASVLSAVNYDRSPSLVDVSANVSAEPDTPIEPTKFESFDQAKAAYDAFLPGCNWVKPPTFKRFWYESEKHLSPGVDFVSWQFREHELWTKADSGEIQPRSRYEPVQVAAAEAVDLASGPQLLNVETGEITPLAIKHNQVVEAAAEIIATGAVESIETTDGQTTIATKIEDGKPAETTTTEAAAAATAEPAPAAPAAPVRRQYTDEQYAELKKQAEENFAIELQRKENLYAEISMERAKAEDSVKSLKAEEKGQLESLRLFKIKGPKYPPNPEIKEDSASVAAGQSNQEGESSTAAAAPQTSAHDVSDERYERYKALDLLPIVKGIKGLGTGKLSTLVDSFPTVGKLLEHQKEKGLQWYKSVGRGFGPELGSRIEDALADALKKVE